MIKAEVPSVVRGIFQQKISLCHPRATMMGSLLQNSSNLVQPFIANL